MTSSPWSPPLWYFQTPNSPRKGAATHWGSQDHLRDGTDWSKFPHGSVAKPCEKPPWNQWNVPMHPNPTTKSHNKWLGLPSMNGTSLFNSRFHDQFHRCCRYYYSIMITITTFTTHVGHHFFTAWEGWLRTHSAGTMFGCFINWDTLLLLLLWFITMQF